MGECLCDKNRRCKEHRQLILTESVMTHMLADLDQIITEMEMNPDERSLSDWITMLRWTVDGEDYKQ